MFTKEELKRQMAEMGLKSIDIVLIHTSRIQCLTAIVYTFAGTAVFRRLRSLYSSSVAILVFATTSPQSLGKQ